MTSDHVGILQLPSAHQSLSLAADPLLGKPTQTTHQIIAQCCTTDKLLYCNSYIKTWFIFTIWHIKPMTLSTETGAERDIRNWFPIIAKLLYSMKLPTTKNAHFEIVDMQTTHSTVKNIPTL